MADIQIDAGKAERMIAQILREERGLLPADANATAASICRRLSSAMATPNEPSGNYRIIARNPPHGSDFAIAVANSLKEAKGGPWTASELWDLVYGYGRDLPASVALPPR
jgi:hypothetical protein